MGIEGQICEGPGPPAVAVEQEVGMRDRDQGNKVVVAVAGRRMPVDEEIGRMLDEWTTAEVRLGRMGQTTGRFYLVFVTLRDQAHREDPCSDRPADVLVSDEGTLWMFWPLTDAAKAWFDERVESDPCQWLGPRLGVSHRYGPPIVEGLRRSGFRVATG